MNELSSWKKNKVYEEVEEDKSERCLGTRWVITNKEKDGRSFCKGRLVIKGFQEQLKSEECDAPTCSGDGLKVVLGLIKLNGWQVFTMDIKTAYLQGKSFTRKVCIKPPMEAQVEKGKVWKLNKHYVLT